QRVSDEHLPVLNNERKRNGRSGLVSDGEAVSDEDNLRLHAGRRILYTDPHPCRVKLTISEMGD
ncbi:hypothetical protein RVM25_36880, partial [Enterobacter hormaechei subsp. xiangfangensis]